MTLVESSDFEVESLPTGTSSLISGRIFYQGTSYFVVKVRISTSEDRRPANSALYIKTEPGGTWELMTAGWDEWHTISTIGNSLYYRIDAESGQVLRVEETVAGKSRPLRVEYILRKV